MTPTPRFESQLFTARTQATPATDAQGWRLVEPLRYWSAIVGRVTVPAGFHTDFASVPRLPFAFLFFGDRVFSAAVVHDYLCRVEYPACHISWRQAAAVFMEAMRAERVPRWQRWPMYAAVRFAGTLKTTPCAHRARATKEPA